MMMPYRHKDQKECFFPLPMCYTKEEWDKKVSDFLTNKSKTSIDGFLTQNTCFGTQTVQRILYDDDNWYVVFWTQDFVFSMQSKYTETYNGNYDDIDVSGLPRNHTDSVSLPF